MSRSVCARIGLVLVLVLSVGCAEQADPIDRVQPSALDKRFFVGLDLAQSEDDPEFYTATTVVDVPFGADRIGIFPGLTGSLRRIQWEIQADVLNARLSYEQVEGVQGPAFEPSQDGQVIAAYPIESHFDIQRAYNPATGEELNIIEENSTDRPWYERRYMRVDWSRNLIGSSMLWDPLAQLEAMGDSVETEPLAYTIDDPDHPDAPVFADGYFDVTNKVYVEPKTVQIKGHELNACSFRSSIVAGATGPHGNCESSEITLRHSFRRVAEPGDPDFSDYEPVLWDGGRMNAFGAFSTQRFGWDDRHGIVDHEWRRFAQRYDIWQKSHAQEPCTADEQCPGSRCDVLAGLCTIPYAQREVRPIVWHVTLGSDDPALWEATVRAADEWSSAVESAVRAARLVECRALGGDDCDAVPQPPKMVLLCHNPVSETDPEACGERGLSVRPGDIRFHHVVHWPTRQQNSPWGYAPTLADPLTGEAISTAVHVYDAVTRLSAQASVDQIRWINGELATEDFLTGSYVRTWPSANQSSMANATRDLAGGLRLSAAEASKRLLGMNGMNEAAISTASKSVDLRPLRDLIKRDLWWERLSPTASGAHNAEFDARVAAVTGTPIEAALTNGAWQQMAGADLSSSDPEQVLDAVSPLRGMRSQLREIAEHGIATTLASRGQCAVAAPDPTGLPALANVMAKKFPRPDSEAASDAQTRVDRMWSYLRSRLTFSVIAHEMGHTFGLRHNFTGSQDKFNFLPQYWQLRTSDGAVTEPCTGPVEDGKSCIGPRYWDPLTKDEIDQSIWSFQQTTVMDYPGEPAQGALTLGRYDRAAIRMLYADVVDVVDDPALIADVRAGDGTPLVEGTAAGNEIAGLVDFAGGLIGQLVLRPGTKNQFMHYSEYNRWFGLIRNCRPADTSAPPGWDEAEAGVYDPVFDGRIVLGNVCDPIPTDLVRYDDLVADTVTDIPSVDPRVITVRRARDPLGRPRVPYAFESDEHADGWSPSTYRHDSGADLFEALTYHSSTYENRHIFDNFRNGRVDFTIHGAYQGAVSRYHSKLARLAQGVAFLSGFYTKELAKNQGVSHAALLASLFGPGSPYHDSAIGAALAFDHFVRVLTRPHVGPHVVSGNRLVPTEDAIGLSSASSVLDMPNGSWVTSSGDFAFGGRPLNNGFQLGQGYYGTEYLNQVGSYYEKTFAFQALLEASYRSFNFLRLDGLDARFHHVNFTDLFGDGMRRLIGAMLTGNVELFAPRLTATTNGLPEVESDLSPKQALGWVSFASKDGPEICWPFNGNLVCRDTLGNPIDSPQAPESITIDPQLGFEVQKFIAFWSYVYLPSAHNHDWLDSMRIWIAGPDNDPDFLPKERAEWRDPQTGLRYIAKRHGTELLFGKQYDRGIAAKMIDWQNTLTERAYELDPDQPFDPETGAANVIVDAQGKPRLRFATSCEDSAHCQAVRDYRGLLDFMRDTAARIGFGAPDL